MTLASVLEPMPPQIRVAVEAIGVETLRDIAGFAISRWMAKTPPPAELHVHWEQLWQHAKQDFAEQLQNVDATVKQVCVRQQVTALAQQAHRPPAVPRPPTKRKHVEEKAAGPVPHLDKPKAVQGIMNLIMVAGPASAFHDELVACTGPEQMQSWQDAYCRSIAARFEIGSISNAQRAHNRLKGYLRTHGHDVQEAFHPTALMLHSWLADCAKGGPAAASHLLFVAVAAPTCWSPPAAARLSTARIIP